MFSEAYGPSTPHLIATTQQASSPDRQANRFTLTLRIAFGLAGKGHFLAGFQNSRYGANCGNNNQSIDNITSFKLLKYIV